MLGFDILFGNSYNERYKELCEKYVHKYASVHPDEFKPMTDKCDICVIFKHRNSAVVWSNMRLLALYYYVSPFISEFIVDAAVNTAMIYLMADGGGTKLQDDTILDLFTPSSVIYHYFFCACNTKKIKSDSYTNAKLLIGVRNFVIQNNIKLSNIDKINTYDLGERVKDGETTGKNCCNHFKSQAFDQLAKTAKQDNDTLTVYADGTKNIFSSDFFHLNEQRLWIAHDLLGAKDNHFWYVTEDVSNEADIVGVDEDAMEIDHEKVKPRKYVNELYPWGYSVDAYCKICFLKTFPSLRKYYDEFETKLNENISVFGGSGLKSCIKITLDEYDDAKKLCTDYIYAHYDKINGNPVCQMNARKYFRFERIFSSPNLFNDAGLIDKLFLTRLDVRNKVMCEQIFLALFMDAIQRNEVNAEKLKRQGRIAWVDTILKTHSVRI